MPEGVDGDPVAAWLPGQEPLLELGEGIDADAVLRALGERGYDAARVDLRGVADKAGILAGFHASLNLGDWFGFNWDALEDALYGPQDRTAPQRVVVLTGVGALRLQAGDEAAILIDILRTVAGTPDSGLRGCVLVD